MSGIFNDMENISSTKVDRMKNTREDEVFRLADSIEPIKANTLREPQIIQAERLTFKKKALLELAHFVNPELREAAILSVAIDNCEDYKTVSLESNEIQEMWFKPEGIKNFLKCCEPREKDLFN